MSKEKEGAPRAAEAAIGRTPGGGGAAGSRGAPERIDRERFERHLSRSEFYPYAGPPASFDVRQGRARRGVEVTEVRFASTLPSGNAANDVVTARLFMSASTVQSEARPRPVVFLHGLGLPRLAMWESFVASLARRGFPTLLVGLPFLCERAPTGVRHGHAYTSTRAEDALPAYEQAVADVRASLDWLLLRQEAAGYGAAAEPVVMGVSLGAFIAVIAAALEPRFRTLVCVLGGADLDAVVFGGTYGPLIQRQLDEAGITIENRRNARRAYRAYLDAVREARHPLDVRAPFHFFLFDPLTFAHHLRTRPALLLNARLDPIVPRRAADQLWLELGQPPRSLFWGTHWAGGPWKPYVIGRVAAFLSGLSPGADRRPADSRAVPSVP